MIARIPLLSRGIALVMFPLICQVVFVVLLCSLLEQVERGIALQFRKNTVTEKFTALYLSMGDVISARKGLTTSAIERLRWNVNELIEASAFDEDLRAKSVNLPKQLDFLPQWYSWRQPALHQYSREQFQEMDRQRTLPIITKVSHLSSDFLSALEPSTQDKAFTRSAKKQVTLILVFGASLSLPVALLLGYFYATSIRGPLQRIRVNSRLLSERKPLLPALEGDNELSNLDRLLHQAALSIEQVTTRERSLIANVAGLICSLDSEGTILEASDYVSHLLGISSHEIVGRNILDLVDPKDALSADEFLRKLPAATETLMAELTLRQASGQSVMTRWSAFWSADEQRIFAVANDITQQKQLDRLKEDFLNIVVEGLRTPLSSIVRRSEYLAGRLGGKTSRAQSEIESVQKNVQKLLSLVDEVILYQQLNTADLVPNLEECSLKSICTEVKEIVAAFAGSKNLTITVASDDATIHGDRKQIFQLVLNLVSNAIKFSPQDGAIDLRITRGPRLVELSVIDQGPGVAESLRESIFEPFNQGRREGEGGSGLGLATCKIIAQAHGATVGVRARAEQGKDLKGSEFWFRKPEPKPIDRA